MVRLWRGGLMEYSEVTKKEKLVLWVSERRCLWQASPPPNKKDAEWTREIRLLKVFQTENFMMEASCYSRKTGKSDWCKAGEGSKRSWRCILDKLHKTFCTLPRFWISSTRNWKLRKIFKLANHLYLQF